MADVNCWIVMGRLTREPEQRTDTGPVTFSLAVNRYAKGEEKVSYFDFNAWGKTGEIILNHLHKGSQVTITAEPRQDRWEQDGVKRSKVVGTAHQVHFHAKKDFEPVVPQQAAPDDSELPF